MQTHRTKTGISCLLLVFALALGFSHRAAAAVKFAHEFAPSDTFVKAPEQGFRRDLCLNGKWQFQPVALPAGFREGVDPAPALPQPTASGWDQVPLRVPSPWNVNSFADRNGLGGDFHTYPSYPAAWEKVEMGWMRRSVQVPADWKGGRIVLHFNGVAGDLKVLVNGKEAGGHFDTFFPFQLDITDMVKVGGDNEILLGIRKPSLFDVKGRYGRRNYQGGSFWGQHIAGVWQDVDLVYVPGVHVSDVFVQSLVDRDQLSVQVTVANDTAADASIDVSAAAHRWISLADRDGSEVAVPKWTIEDKASLVLDPSSVSVPAHSTRTLVLTRKVAGSLRLWSPDDPALYGLLVDVKANGQRIDCKYQRFGWRQIKFAGSTLQLNGKLLILKGDSWHFMGIPQMTRRYAWAWFSALHDAHMNAVRLHAEPYPEFYLDVADEMGVFVLDETAIWASDGGPKLDSEAFWQDTGHHVESLVLRDRNHPSVFGWSICNEVKPIVQGVFHGPQAMYQTLLNHYQMWAAICRKLDPTREWISADGDDDGGGFLPAYVVHYGGTEAMTRASKTGKPWGVGEASGAYYATPEQASKYIGERAYESFQGRMEGIAIESYDNLLHQRELGASYRSVFNVAWYSLKPLPLGMADTTRPPSLEDGVVFPDFVEGKPGVQPERLGAYSTTLNPGYDPKLPKYETWPLFDAIRAVNSDPVQKIPWSRQPDSSVPAPKAKPVASISVVAGAGSRLAEQLSQEGVPFDRLKASGTPQLLFVDGVRPPEADAKALMDQVLAAGGKVIVWGASRDSLDKLNALLPAQLALSNRKASSLVPAGNDPLTEGFKLSELYFSEPVPFNVLDGGLDGPIVSSGKVLLRASNTDWALWNKQAEYAKTAMVYRSEQETKSSGAAIVALSSGRGQLLVCNLPVWTSLYKEQVLVQRLLQNLGIHLNAQVDVGQPFLRSGRLMRVLAAGAFPIATEKSVILDSQLGAEARDNNRIGDLRWNTLTAAADAFEIAKSPLNSQKGESAIYFSMWVQSPRALDNLLLEPNVPKVDLQLQFGGQIELFLNRKKLPVRSLDGRESVAEGLPLQQGWNQILVRVVRPEGGDSHFGASLRASDPAFLSQLNSSLQKP